MAKFLVAQAPSPIGETIDEIMIVNANSSDEAVSKYVEVQIARDPDFLAFAKDRLQKDNLSSEELFELYINEWASVGVFPFSEIEEIE